MKCVGDACPYSDTAWCNGGCRLHADARVAPMRTTPRAVENEFEPDAKIVEHCEQLLKDAQSGKLRGLAYGTVHHDGLVPSGSVEWGFVMASGAGFAVGESISRLRHAWDKDRDT